MSETQKEHLATYLCAEYPQCYFVAKYILGSFKAELARN